MNPPTGYTVDTLDGYLICQHRDLSVCTSCATAHDEIVEVFGVHYWIPDADERQHLATIGRPA